MEETKRSYNAYDKKVTLRLALASTAAEEAPGLKDAIRAAIEVDWKFEKLAPEKLEVIYAEFDSTLEQRVKDEFEADPAFLIDLRHSNGVCPLCGHVGIRWVFRIANHKGGESVECGSECIIVHGLHVKGTETADHARRVLEGAIRRRMRELLIQKWHLDYGFKSEHLASLQSALSALRNDYSLPWEIRRGAFWKLRDLAKLFRFYESHGWLGTEKKWSEWSRLAKFARQHSEAAREDIPFPKPWVDPGTTEETEAVALVPTEAPAAPEAAPAPVEAPAPVVEAPVKAEPEPAPVQKPSEPLTGMAALAHALVFGG